jgi:hypothetical protein
VWRRACPHVMTSSPASASAHDGAEHTLSSSPHTNVSIPTRSDTPATPTTVADADDDDGDSSEDEGGEDGDDASVREVKPTAEERAQEIERIVKGEQVAYSAAQEKSGDHHDRGDEEEDDDEEEDSDEDDDDDDEEPALKYERIGGDAASVLSKKDSASAIAISGLRMVSVLDSVLFAPHTHQAIGTHMGIVHVMDLEGTSIKMFRPHSASILDICMDATGDFVGTASINGSPTPPSCLLHSSQCARTGRPPLRV